MRILALALLAALTAGSARAQNWADETSPAQFAGEYAPSKALCRKLDDREPPASDRPTAAQSRALKGCSSEALYYGQGMKPDYAKARMCAFIEADGADDQVFGGSTILMQLYANGLGVKRDLDVATAYACSIEGAPAERSGRVDHLAALKAHPSGKRFDYCDDITSGLAGGFCASRDAEKAKDGRTARTRALTARIPPAARSSFTRLQAASDGFVSAHGDGEVDMSGTARAQMEIDEEEAVRDRFLAHVGALLNGKWPPATPAQAKAADDALNAAYRKAQAHLGSKDSFTTVKPDGSKTAQRAWLAYRDAFVKFATLASPGVGRDAATTLLTNERTAQLSELAQ
ncbi:DUF1311 domain-containing protein [soil metagenome]